MSPFDYVFCLLFILNIVLNVERSFIEPEDLPQLSAELFSQLDLSHKHRIAR